MKIEIEEDHTSGLLTIETPRGTLELLTLNEFRSVRHAIGGWSDRNLDEYMRRYDLTSPAAMTELLRLQRRIRRVMRKGR